jgi:hypothetical protein
MGYFSLFLTPPRPPPPPPYIDMFILLEKSHRHESCVAQKNIPISGKFQWIFQNFSANMGQKMTILSHMSQQKHRSENFEPSHWISNNNYHWAFWFN